MNPRLPIAAIGLLSMLGCLTGPRQVQYSPRLYLHQNQPKELWLTMKDGSNITMVGPRIIDDTLFGWTPGANEDLTVAISDVKSLKARRIDPIRTAMIPTAFVGAGVAVYLLVHHPSGVPDSTGGIYCPDGECDN